MKDELLMRFIDGTATPSEVETVMEMLSKDDEAAKEWMQMAHAARLAETPPAVAISEQDAEQFILNTLHKTEVEAATPSGKLRRLPWIFGSVAAAAAVTLVVSLSFGSGRFGKKSDMNENLQAGVVPEDTVKAVVSDDFVEETPYVAPELMDVKEYVAHADDNDGEVVSQNTITEDVTTAGKCVVEFTGNVEEEMEEPVFTVVRPAKTPYRVRIKNIEKDFVFEWESSCVSSVSMVIADSKGMVLMDKTLDPADGNFPVKAAELANKGELVWTLTATFCDGGKQVHTGEIEFVIQ